MLRNDSCQHRGADNFLTDTLGRWRTVDDHSRRSGRVLRVQDHHGGSWIVKNPTLPIAFAAELRAYREWVPTFADQAPALISHDEATRTLILSWLPGAVSGTRQHPQHRDAGRLLARIHSAPVSGPEAALGERMHRRLDAALQRAPVGLIKESDHQFATRSIVELDRSHADMPQVPCHGDFGPHNWLRHAEKVTAIDFGAAAVAPVVWDFARLFLGPWWERPAIAAAFFEGYGRTLTGEEQEAVRLLTPVFAISLLTHAVLSDDRQLARRARRRLDLLACGVNPATAPTGWRALRQVLRRQR